MGHSRSRGDGPAAKPGIGNYCDGTAWSKQTSREMQVLQSPSAEACHKWNTGGCSYPRSHFMHVCSGCGGSHQLLHCSSRKEVHGPNDLTNGGVGLPVALDKLEGPASRLTFLGFELDTEALEVWLPQRKLEELKEVCSGAVDRKKVMRGKGPGVLDW